ncbi:MAG TPA: FAD-dependent oxidoreductase [Actinomycetota bacterium]
MSRRIVVIGAGVVGAALADELTALGETEVTVLDKGPLWATGGSSSHAPGLVSRTSPSKMMQLMADATVRKYATLAADGGPAGAGVGTLEVALNETRLAELQRRWQFAHAWGWRGEMLTPDEAVARWPIVDGGTLVGAYATADEGVATALRAVAAQAEAATARGARFLGEHVVTGIEREGGRVTGVLTDRGAIPADVVVCCAGVWGPVIAGMVGLTLPMVAFEHQYVVTSPLPELAANAEAEAMMPIVRHHDAGLYFRDHGAAVGIGSFNHRRLPVVPAELDRHPRREDGIVYRFTPEDFEEPWRLAVELMPALAGASFDRAFNGVFAFTPDGYPLMGEHPDLAGFWVAESVWVTHSVGVARALAESLVHGGAELDTSPADLSRFEDVELDPAVFEARCDDSYRDVYAVHHPAEAHTSARDLRFSAFAPRQRELGAAFFDVAAWERPRWYEGNAALAVGLPLPPRDEWASRYWSPIVAAEHLAVREHGGLIDMTALTRIAVEGPDAEALLLEATAGRVDRPPGAVTYTVMLDERGGIRSDVTVARLDAERYLVGANGPRDVARLRAAVPGRRATVHPLAAETCCLGLWGPSAREVLAAATEEPLDAPYLSVRELDVAGVPTVATRISYAGEFGWELTCPTTHGLALWDALWPLARAYGLVAAGSGALKSLRLEKGYRAWGVDVTPEHGPHEAGLGFTVRTDGPTFVGAEALAGRAPAARRLATLVFDDPQPASGGEPIFDGGDVVGYVTSSEYGWSVGRAIALAWVPAGWETGHRAEVAYFGRRLGATVAEDVLFDRAGERLRA